MGSWTHKPEKRQTMKEDRQAAQRALAEVVDEPAIRTDGGPVTMGEMYGDGHGGKMTDTAAPREVRAATHGDASMNDDKVCHTLGMALVDEIANDGFRNAAGGIYATSVQEFATEIQRNFAQANGLLVPGLTICRSDGRCQYAIDHGSEDMGHCPKGKCSMPDHGGPVA